jgi:hypothetical protein
MVRNMAVLVINGVTISPDPNQFQWVLTDLSSDNSGRSASGTMMKDRIAQKVKISPQWAFLTQAQALTLLQALNANIFFTVTYPDPLQGTTVTNTFYVGDRTVPMFSYQNGVAGWENIAFDLIQE